MTQNQSSCMKRKKAKHPPDLPSCHTPVAAARRRRQSSWMELEDKEVGGFLTFFLIHLSSSTPLILLEKKWDDLIWGRLMVTHMYTNTGMSV